ncbi:response regulator transcription factor [Ruminococcaceae bacterium OttesenSCG-928-A11]|nr:response regulator transcription factor [Ruminococcaceae bacterium OttesenSCG-928-A11]
MEKIKVVLAEDNPVLRQMLAEALLAEDGIELLGQAADGLELLELCEQAAPDVAVVDIRMPRMDGVAAARRLRAALPGVRLLILTTFDDEEYLRELFGIGIDGYLLKNDDLLPLAEAIRGVHRGISMLDSRIGCKLGSLLKDGGGQPAAPAPLTEMERRVAGLIAEGKYNKDIAVELDISYGRARNIVSSLYRKLGALSRADLVNRLGRGDT